MIVVVGASGQLGGKIARGLLARGKPVRVFARRESSVARLVEAGATVAIGDLRDRASLDAACRGATTLISTANSARRTGDDNVQTVDLDGTRNLIDAAKAAGVGHVVYTSVLIWTHVSSQHRRAMRRWLSFFSLPRLVTPG